MRIISWSEQCNVSKLPVLMDLLWVFGELGVG